MLRKNPEHRPTAAELLRHPHLQPYLTRCRSPSNLFLSKAPTKRKNNYFSRKRPSSTSSSSSKGTIETEACVVLKEMKPNPLFEETSSKNNASPSLVNTIEENLVTKRVDPTSCYKSMSTATEKSNDGDNRAKIGSSSSSSVRELDSFGNTRSSRINSLFESEENGKNSAEIQRHKVYETNIAKEVLKNSNVKIVEDDVKGGERVISIERRANALESLLELCARLLEQGKLKELAGVLSPFGEETVSSRETAIWLAKGLITADKI